MATFEPRSSLGRRVVACRGELIAAAADRRASNLRVFGSVARGEDTDSSDVDFLVDLDVSATPMDLLSLGCDLEDILGTRVDIGTPESLRPVVRDEIMAEAVSV
ncbi:MAG: nucleotidyltransferase family protein [Actinomycetia bacterium]|nr:nucleotidyltransferase family protein [Actinomycetes bacterium]